MGTGNICAPGKKMADLVSLLLLPVFLCPRVDMRVKDYVCIVPGIVGNIFALDGKTQFLDIYSTCSESCLWLIITYTSS